MRIDKIGSVYANGKMRVVVVKEIYPRDAEDPVGTLNFEGTKFVVTEDIMLAYLICADDGNVKVLLTTEADLERRGFKRLYSELVEDVSYRGHEACEVHS